MKTLTIAPLSMSATATNLLDLALKKAGGGLYALGQPTQADVVILDFDAVNSAQLIQTEQANHPQRPILALSIRPQIDVGLVHLQKPLRVETLMAVLKQVAKQLESGGFAPIPSATVASPKPPAASEKPVAPRVHAPMASEKEVFGADLGGRLKPSRGDEATLVRTLTETQQLRTRGATKMLETEAVHALCGTGPDIPLDDPRRATAAFYDPQNFIQGRLFQAMRAAAHHNCPVQVQAIKPIVIFPHTQLAYTELDDRRLRAVSLMPASPDVQGWQLMPSDHVPYNYQRSIDLEVLLWQVAIWTSHGRLPTGTNPQRAVGLRGWPNMTRLPLPPHALRIAALWNRQFTTLIDTAQSLNVPQRVVFGFYSACDAVNLLEYGEEKTAPIAAEKVAPSPTQQAAVPQRGFLQRLLSVLRRAA